MRIFFKHFLALTLQIYNVVKTELKSIFDFFGQNARNKADSFITFLRPQA